MYDEDEEGLYFNPYTNSYDDVYGDYYFDDIEDEVATCSIGEDGKPKFNGELCSAIFESKNTQSICQTIANLQTNVLPRLSTSYEWLRLDT